MPAAPHRPLPSGVRLGLPPCQPASVDQGSLAPHASGFACPGPPAMGRSGRPWAAPTPIATCMAIRMYVVCAAHTQEFCKFQVCNFWFTGFAIEVRPRYTCITLHCMRYARRVLRALRGCAAVVRAPVGRGMGPDSPPRDWASTLPATPPPGTPQPDQDLSQIQQQLSKAESHVNL